MNNPQKNNGFALIIVLLFTLLISLLTFTIYESLQLEMKLTNYTAMKSLSRTSALQGLENAERNLKTQNNLSDKTTVNLISNTICGIDFYRITSVGNFKNITTKIQSTFAIINPLAKCQTRSIIKEGRKSWREIK